MVGSGYAFCVLIKRGSMYGRVRAVLTRGDRDCVFLVYRCWTCSDGNEVLLEER
jgi:hypothetical protein